MLLEVLVPAIILSGAYFCYYQNNVFDISKYEVKLKKKKNLRILQLSDLHGKMFGKNNIDLIKEIEGLNPNLIIATGDLIDSNLKNMDKIIWLLAQLNKQTPVVYIPGNNEGRCKKLEYILNELNNKGVIVLINEIKTILINEEMINILGLFEERFDDGEMFYNKAKSRYINKEDRELFKELEALKGIKIVLSHYPENYSQIGEDSYEKYKFDLMFAGHAHGGQFIIPGIGGLFSPGQGVLPKIYKGVYGHKNKLIVSAGLGNSGFPLRLFNRPNIVVVDI